MSGRPDRLAALHDLDPIRARSPLLVAAFERIMARAMLSDFHAVRISGPLPAPPPDRPLVVYANHPSWWDPAFFVVLGTRLFPERRGFGPIDVEALARYPFMSRIGLFGVEPTGRRGGARFLRTALRILADPRAVLWITPEGRFADPRQRPVRLRPGLAHLARRSAAALFVPLALEYPFWEERKPEALCRFGPPLDAAAFARRSVTDASAALESSLAATMDALAEDAVAREPKRFRILLRGRGGVGGVYDLWRRMRAGLRDEPFRPEHGNL